MKKIKLKKGFYRHFKGKYYEVLNIAHGKQRDKNGLEHNVISVIYRPLYESYVYGLGKQYDSKEIQDFLEPVFHENKWIERYVLVTDPRKIEELSKIRDEMYQKMPEILEVDLENEVWSEAQENFMTTPIEELDITHRLLQFFIEHQIKNLKQIAGCSYASLSKLKNADHRVLDEIRRVLSEKGIALRD